MKTVYNIPRRTARQNTIVLKNTIWISIEEPDEPDSVVKNPAMEALPHLKIAFWDVTAPMQFPGYYALPPSFEDAKKIVDFLKQYPEHDVVVNCAMGISRSGAIAQFCQDILEYNWAAGYKAVATPNTLLYRLMVNYHYETLASDETSSESDSTQSS